MQIDGRQTSLKTRLRRNLPRLIGWCFGILWAWTGASALPHPYDRVGRAFILLSALLFLVRIWRNEPLVVGTKSLFRAPAYFIAVFTEIVAIYAASFVLPRFGAKQQVFSVVGCIVGLHFIGLWVATRRAQFLRIAAGMCFISLLSMAMPYAWHGIGLRSLLLGAGNAIVLWLATSRTD